MLFIGTISLLETGKGVGSVISNPIGSSFTKGKQDVLFLNAREHTRTCSDYKNEGVIKILGEETR